MTAPGPWHEVEYGPALFRWRDDEFGGMEVQVFDFGTGEWALAHVRTRIGFFVGYHARRELVRTLLEKERQGGGS